MTLRFALNHMVAPQLDLRSFFQLARDAGVTDVEIRNDIAGKAIIDGTSAATVKALAEEAGVTILTINALQKFNRWDAAREAEAAALAQYAHDCGAKALILVPVNDGTGQGAERHDNLRFAMKGLRPILKSNGITGLIEPLGFDTCSLRLKREAAEAIAAIDGYGTFAITHDTFHHHLAGDPELFPSLTGLVHISGVADPALAVERDARRPPRPGRWTRPAGQHRADRGSHRGRLRWSIQLRAVRRGIAGPWRSSGCHPREHGIHPRGCRHRGDVRAAD